MFFSSITVASIIAHTQHSEARAHICMRISGCSEWCIYADSIAIALFQSRSGNGCCLFSVGFFSYRQYTSRMQRSAIKIFQCQCCMLDRKYGVCIRASNNSRARTNNKKNLRRSAKYSFFILFACAILHGKKNSPHIGTKRTENERKKRNVRFVCCIWEIKMQWIFLQLSIYYYTANETKIDDTHCIRRRIAYLNTGWFIREKNRSESWVQLIRAWW